jgi:hypothetical protein
VAPHRAAAPTQARAGEASGPTQARMAALSHRGRLPRLPVLPNFERMEGTPPLADFSLVVLEQLHEGLP